MTNSAIPQSGQSAVWLQENVLDIHDVPVPELQQGDALIRIRAAGICGSDLHAFHEGTRRALPGIGPGHELAGEVVALGPGTAGPEPGTRVALLAARVCNVCEFCRSGRAHLCPKIRIAGGGYAGGMGEYFVAHAQYVYPVPDGMSWEVAALSEPCGISLHAMKRGGLVRGQRVLILGAGTIGLFAALVAHDAGASRIGITARYPQQAAAARSLGVTDVFESDEVNGRSPVAGMGWDIVVETVGGSAQTLQQAIEVVARAGRIVLVGVHTVPQSIQTGRVFFHEITIAGSFGYDCIGPRSDYEETITILNKYHDLVAPLVTHTYPLAQASEAFATALDKRSGAIKVTVLP